MTTVAIHQPNYAPWLGYFHKMARADVFVFLDDVQFSKQSYINRVRILGDDGGRWLTEPVTVRLGQPINQVFPAKPDWACAHLDTLRGFYRKTAAFGEVWPEIERLYRGLPGGNLAAINQALIKGLAAKLGIGTAMRRSSALDTGGATADDRLVAILGALAPGGIYLSGRGGASYQDDTKFVAAGFSLVYADFEHPVYDQGRADFTEGLSVLDAAFHLGWDGAGELVRS